MTQSYFEQITHDVFVNFMEQFFNYKPQIELHQESLKKDGHYDNVIFISIFGAIEGGFILEVDNNTVEELLDSVHQAGMKKKMVLADLVKGYIGEFGNVLVSKIVTSLGKNFGNTFLSTPSIFTGTGMNVDLFYDQTFTAHLKCDFGLIKISFSVN